MVLENVWGNVLNYNFDFISRERTIQVIYFSSSLRLSRHLPLSPKLLNLKTCRAYSLMTLFISVESVLPYRSFLILILCVFSLFLLIFLGTGLSTVLIFFKQIGFWFQYFFSCLCSISFVSPLSFIIFLFLLLWGLACYCCSSFLR